jgi:hypothetical protein
MGVVPYEKSGTKLLHICVNINIVSIMNSITGSLHIYFPV